MFFSSAGCTNVIFVRLCFLLVSFLVRMWLLYACLRLILPVPVSLNRFLAPDLVFILGMACGRVGRVPIEIVLTPGRRSSGLLLLFWDQVHDHPFSFQLRHLLHDRDILQFLGELQK